jgi:exopolyphosphatase/guanosine-5'-triphosphate,3'-diphosphate pyrophosphatase
MAKAKKQTSNRQSTGIQPSDLFAVIELGSTSVRMTIAQVQKQQVTKTLDSLQQSISLGRDTFTTGAIGRKTTEACVSAIKSFLRVLKEYDISPKTDHVRAVASSAVREATNRDVFLDRILIATGVEVVTLEEAEVNRLTYRAVRPILGKRTSFKKSDTLVIEIGGGSTETLMFQRGKVTNSHMYKMGSLRLAQSLDDMAISRKRVWQVMEQTIDQTVEQVHSTISPSKSLDILALGADMRFAASELQPSWDRHSLISLSVSALQAFTESLLPLSSDELVSRYHLSYEDADTVRPALLIYCRLAAKLKVKRIFVAEVNLRTGMLTEMATGGIWTAEFKDQIVNSATEVAMHFGTDMRHVRHVSHYAHSIFRHLQQEYFFTARHEMILTVASLLHEVGFYVNDRAHHKHSYYLISNSDIFGFSAHDIQLAALVARYHRRSPPKSSHSPYMSLPRKDRLIVSQLAAILRIANVLDTLKDRKQGKITCQTKGRSLILITTAVTNLLLVQKRINDRADLFTRVYGLDVVVRQTLKGTHP